MRILLKSGFGLNRWRGGSPRKLKFGNVFGGQAAKITNA
jgi:hypothetical protein